jgi:hypothetical protein
VLVVFTGGGTGGHLYPALAIARALVRLRPDVEPFFIGAQRGVERSVLPGTGFPSPAGPASAVSKRSVAQLADGTGPRHVLGRIGKALGTAYRR